MTRYLSIKPFCKCNRQIEQSASYIHATLKHLSKNKISLGESKEDSITLVLE